MHSWRKWWNLAIWLQLKLFGGPADRLNSFPWNEKEGNNNLQWHQNKWNCSGSASRYAFMVHQDTTYLNTNPFKECHFPSTVAFLLAVVATETKLAKETETKLAKTRRIASGMRWRFSCSNRDKVCKNKTFCICHEVAFQFADLHGWFLSEKSHTSWLYIPTGYQWSRANIHLELFDSVTLLFCF